MVQYGDCRDGYVVFNINDNLIEGGCNSQVTFFIKKDGSSSFGGGLNGQSFKALLDTPNKIQDGKLLGGCGDKIQFIDSVDLDNIIAEKINSRDICVDGMLKVNGAIDNLGLFTTKGLNVKDNLSSQKACIEDLIVDTIEVAKVVDTLKLKSGEILCDSIIVETIEVYGTIIKPTEKVGSMEAPINISKAETNTFDLGENTRLEIIGKHFKSQLEFTIKTTKTNLCHTNNIDVNIISLYGDDLLVVGKMIKQLSPYEILIKVIFDKEYNNDIIEKIVVDVN